MHRAARGWRKEMFGDITKDEGRRQCGPS